MKWRGSFLQFRVSLERVPSSKALSDGLRPGCSELVDSALLDDIAQALFEVWDGGFSIISQSRALGFKGFWV